MLFSLEVGSNVGCSVGHLILQWRDLNIGSAPFERAKCSRSGARRSLCCGRFTRGCLWIVRGGEFDVLTSHPSGRRRRYVSYRHSIFQPMDRQVLLPSRPSSGPLSWAARCHVSGWLALLLYFYLKPTSLLGRRAKGRSFPLGVQDVCRRHHGPLLTLSLNTTVFTRPPTRCGRLLLVVDLLSLVRWSDAGISPLPCSAPGFVACQPSAQPRRPWADGPALSGAGRSYYTPGSSLLQLRNLFLFFRFCNTRGVASLFPLNRWCWARSVFTRLAGFPSRLFGYTCRDSALLRATSGTPGCWMITRSVPARCGLGCGALGAQRSL